MTDAPDTLRQERLKAKVWHKMRGWSALYLMALPSILSLAIFSYYPKIDVVIMSFFRWEPPTIQEFIGLDNFTAAFADPLFWDSFRLVGILLVANVIKLGPGILAAIALHRLANDRLRYIFQVLFVVPMIIPGMVWLLIWKNFYDPSLGIFNQFLNATGLMSLLSWLDTAMPALATSMEPIFAHAVNPLAGSLGGLFLIGAMVTFVAGWKHFEADRFQAYGLLIGFACLPLLAQVFQVTATFGGLLVFTVMTIVAMVYLARALQSLWILWALAVAAGGFVFRDEPWRLPLSLGLVLGLFEVVRRRYSFHFGKPILMYIGWSLLGVASLLLVLGGIWIEPVGQFEGGTPAWLGNPDLVVPALLFWGFPWVGTVGVLIYLSGLQNIPQDVYEAAELDGVGPLGTLFYIELPLIMTQIRINLIFMTIGTLTTYEMFLILLGPEGGPGNRGMVPGLYMFSSAFTEGRFGYACALGMILFVIILTLTIIYQRYVKVEK